MYNKVTLIGRLGKDPEVRRLENGVAVTKIGIATTEYYRDQNNNLQEQTEWHDVVMWRGLADNAEKVLKKGFLIFVEGKLTHRKYQTQNGEDRYTTEVVANTFKVLNSPQGSTVTREGYLPTQEPPMNNASREVVTAIPPSNSRPQNSPPPPQQQRAEPVFEIVPPPSEDSAPVASDDLPF
jgi:single-strand DNA-binding protein